jgi:hypothetical protein
MKSGAAAGSGTRSHATIKWGRCEPTADEAAGRADRRPLYAKKRRRPGSEADTRTAAAGRSVGTPRGEGLPCTVAHPYHGRPRFLATFLCHLTSLMPLARRAARAILSRWSRVSDFLPTAGRGGLGLIVGHENMAGTVGGTSSAAALATGYWRRRGSR